MKTLYAVEHFEKFIDTLNLKGILQYDYFVNWAKVLNNIEPIEKELNLLNTAVGKENIEELLFNIFKEYPKADFSIQGHTDSDGPKKSNQLLSERRANAVRDYLISNGISAERLTASGFGEDYPIDSNKTRAGKKNNRRVEVKLRN